MIRSRHDLDTFTMLKCPILNLLNFIFKLPTIWHLQIIRNLLWAESIGTLAYLISLSPFLVFLIFEFALQNWLIINVVNCALYIIEFDTLWIHQQISSWGFGRLVNFISELHLALSCAHSGPLCLWLIKFKIFIISQQILICLSKF